MAILEAKSVWVAVRRPGFLFSSWPWRATAYLLSSTPVGLAGLIAILTAIAVGGALTVVLVGVPFLVAAVLSGIPMGVIERRRLGMVGHHAMRAPHEDPREPGIGPWFRQRIGEAASWRELAYTLVFVTVLWPLDLLAVVFALTVPVGLMATPYMLAAYGGGESTMALKQWAVTSYPQAWALAALGLLLLPVAAYALTLVAGVRADAARRLLT
ncbi:MULTISPECIES: sensor domain-containing protein [unclassified Streptomyces]|uniref:sensor domain-containing protein n=1 Tax=unclassified Streptomyces TaxID=2593676 RepID=UPI002ED6AEA9|nr:sensor domain-containing protein [Streptomyces sp. NBC_00891]WSY06299.1 sensor domain-containing protein [Streptomyces sp. NBC_00890]WSZ07924.1 sensor domain-containing protein [Streptomyces sp. NBC_00869]WSZ24577.1 sensor domain-containing protein [Streptomyces sp. NBC_00870]